MIRILFLAVFLSMGAIATNAQCGGSEAQTALYNKFLDLRKGGPEQQSAANQIGKEYVAKYGECASEAEKKITEFIKKWLAKYEVAVMEFDCATTIHKTPSQAPSVCAPLLARDPENLRANLLLSLAGIKTISDESRRAQTIKVMRKALDLIKGGRVVDNWIIGTSKDETVATLEFFSAYLTADMSPDETAATMLKLARSSTAYSKNPSTYLYLGRALYESEVKKLVDDYKRTCENKPATAECEAAYKKIDTSVDKVIDAYARAVALGSRDPEHARIVAAARPALTELYKSRHENSESGLDKLIAEVLAKPLP